MVYVVIDTADNNDRIAKAPPPFVEIYDYRYHYDSYDGIYYKYFLAFADTIEDAEELRSKVHAQWPSWSFRDEVDICGPYENGVKAMIVGFRSEIRRPWNNAIHLCDDDEYDEGHVYLFLTNESEEALSERLKSTYPKNFRYCHDIDSE